MIGAELSLAAAEIMGATVAVAAFSAVEAAAADVAVAQPIRVEIFKRGGYSGSELVTSAAIGGALGGVGGASSTAARQIGDITRTLRAFDDLGHTLVELKIVKPPLLTSQHLVYVSPEGQLANAGKATIPEPKLTGYVLNPNHPRGGHKARVFRAGIDW
jgi:hypothetical protein